MCSCLPVLCAKTETAETTSITQPLLYVGKQKWKFSMQNWMKKIWRLYWHGWNSDSVWRRWRRRRRGISLACTESLKQIALSRPLHCRFLWTFPSIKHQLPHEVLDETLGQRELGLDQPKSPPLLPKSLRKHNCRRFLQPPLSTQEAEVIGWQKLWSRKSQQKPLTSSETAQVMWILTQVNFRLPVWRLFDVCVQCSSTISCSELVVRTNQMDISEVVHLGKQNQVLYKRIIRYKKDVISVKF